MSEAQNNQSIGVLQNGVLTYVTLDPEPPCDHSASLRDPDGTCWGCVSDDYASATPPAAEVVVAPWGGRSFQPTPPCSHSPLDRDEYDICWACPA